MDIVQIIAFFLCLTAMLPWVVLVLNSIKFDRDVAHKWGRGIDDQDRLMVVFSPKKFRSKKKNEISSNQIEEILEWYRFKIKKAAKSSFWILIIWGIFYAISFGF